jgi:hypothetical protein
MDEGLVEAGGESDYVSCMIVFMPGNQSYITVKILHGEINNSFTHEDWREWELVVFVY